MRKLASKQKLIEKVITGFKRLHQNTQTVLVYFPFSMKLPEIIPRQAMKVFSSFKLGTNVSPLSLSAASHGRLPPNYIHRAQSRFFFKARESVTLANKTPPYYSFAKMIKIMTVSHTYQLAKRKCNIQIQSSSFPLMFD